jgi:hypothetical protein
VRGNCYIDGIDCYARYGVWITRGGYDGLLAFPALKTPGYNDWPEEDGLEADLDGPRLESKEIAVTFLESRPGQEANDFIDFVSRPGYHTLYIPSLGRTWNIRLAAGPAHKTFRTATGFTLRFIQDMPIRHGGAAPRPWAPLLPSAYEMDGVAFDRYGITVMEAKDSVLKSPVAKGNLSREIQTADGRIYDAGSLVFQSKDVAFKCYLKAVSMEDFWTCHDAFLEALAAPGERSLYVDYTGEDYPCYYKSASAWKLHMGREAVIAEFTLVMVFTAFRVEETQYILAAESGEWIMTEDGEYAIDLKEEYSDAD